MDKKHPKSSDATDDDIKSKCLNKLSPSTNVGNAMGKSVLKHCSESNRKSKLKKQKIHKEKSKENEITVLKDEIKELKNSLKQLSEDIKKNQEILLTKVDQLGDSLKDQSKEACCFECEDARGNNPGTLLVKGFNCLQPRNEIKKALSNFFSSYGVKRVFVPFECETGVPLGFAFIDLTNSNIENINKALELNGVSMEGKELEVKMAKSCNEYYGYTNFRGCGRCLKSLTQYESPSDDDYGYYG